MVQPDREGRVGQRLGWRAADLTGVDVKRQRSGQGRRDRVGAARQRVVGRQRGDGGVVHAHQRRRWNQAERVGVRPSDAHASDRVRPVANAVTVGVGVERVGARVGRIHVGPGVGFHAVGKAVAVVVAVGHKTGGRSFGRVVIAWQVVGKTVAVKVRKAPQVEREGLGGAAVVRGRHRVRRVGQRGVHRAGDFAGASVDGEVARQSGRHRPHGHTVVERWMEANRVDGHVFYNRMWIVSIHAEVQLVRGRIIALIGVNRVPFGSAHRPTVYADHTTRDAHASRQSRVCFPGDKGGCGVPGIAAGNRNR